MYLAGNHHNYKGSKAPPAAICSEMTSHIETALWQVKNMAMRGAKFMDISRSILNLPSNLHESQSP
jgi:hypothetical protein